MEKQIIEKQIIEMTVEELKEYIRTVEPGTFISVTIAKEDGADGRE